MKTDGVFTVKISSAPTTSSGDARGGSELEPEAEKKFVPQPRMSSCLAIKHGILYLYGGIFESGKESSRSEPVNRTQEWRFRFRTRTGI